MMLLTLRRIRDCDRGASIIEMALAAPVLGALLIGMVDLSRAYSDRLQLEQAAQRTIERVAQQRTASSDYSALRAEAAAAAGVPLTSSNPVLSQWLECTPTDGNGTATGAPVNQGNNTLADQCPNDTDLPARYVTIRIQRTYTPVFGSRYLGANNNGTYTLRGEAGVRIQ